MAKEVSDLNKVYDEILGKGEPIQDLAARGRGTDPAYADEDYADDAGDGVDPRDKSTKEDAEGKETETQESLDADAADESERADDPGDDEADEEVIPERLVEAGRYANLPDETIVELAEKQPHVLEALARSQEEAKALAAKSSLLKGADQQDGLDTSKDKNAAGKSKFDKLSFDFGADDEFSPTAKKAVQSLVEKVNELTDVIQKHDQGFGDIQRQRQVEGSRKIDAYFDSVAKDVAVLGKASSLNRQQTEARLFAFRIARGAQQTMEGLSDEDALAIGVNALKGQLTEQQVRTKVVADLNSQKKRFIARPKGRRTVEAKGSRSVEDRALDAINKILDDPSYA